MRKAIHGLSAKKAYLLVWMVLFVVSAISVSWRHFFFEETECMDGLVRSELGVCLAFFLLALVPLNYLRVGQGIVKRLWLNHAWGVLGLACLSFAAVYFLFACRIPGAAELWMLCFLLLSLVLLCVEAEDMAKRWFLPMLLLLSRKLVVCKASAKGREQLRHVCRGCSEYTAALGRAAGQKLACQARCISVPFLSGARPLCMLLRAGADQGKHSCLAKRFGQSLHMVWQHQKRRYRKYPFGGAPSYCGVHASADCKANEYERKAQCPLSRGIGSDAHSDRRTYMV